MEKDKIFFGTEGLTSTSAQFIAEQAKNYVACVVEELNSLSFVNETISLLSGTNERKVAIGNGLTGIDDKLNLIADADSLIAWLREAIKARDNMLTEVKSTRLDKYAKMVGKTIPEEPELEGAITHDDAIAELSIKDRNRYYALQTRAAVYGKFIHPNGGLSVAKKKLEHAITHPTTVEGDGVNTIVHTFTPSVNISKVNELYFAISAKYRGCQAEFNGLEHSITERVSADGREKQAKYSAAKQEYNAYISELKNELSEWKLSKSNEIAGYKIVIPNALKEIYDIINKLGK